MSDGELSELPGHQWVPEPALLFHPDRASDTHVHPLRGLLAFGPYSRSLITPLLDPVRVATICPKGWGERSRALIAEVQARHSARERRQYLPEFPGFSTVFGIGLVEADLPAHELPAALSETMSRAPQPHLVLAEEVARAIKRIEPHRSDFDVLMIFLSDEWESGFEDGSGQFDLHDFVKASTASSGIPCQIITSGALTYSCRASVSWRLSIALYSKAGGIPWKLAGSASDTAFIGVSYALREHGNKDRFVTCCSQVFDEDGAGLEFLAYPARNVRLERKNPFLSRSDMRSVMARSMELYQRRHGGRPPKRVVVHKSTEFKHQEVEGCLDAFSAVGDVELIHVNQNEAWRGVKVEGHKSIAGYPVERGTVLQTGPREALLWTQGNAAETLGRDYYKEGKGIPTPLLLRRYAGHGPFLEAASEVLALTKMNWNNDNLYDRLPATLAYASVLARTLKRIPELSPRPYHLRYFM